MTVAFLDGDKYFIIVGFLVCLSKVQSSVTPFLEQAKHRRKQGISLFISTIQAFGRVLEFTYRSTMAAVAGARPWERPLRLRLRSESGTESSEFS